MNKDSSTNILRARVIEYLNAPPNRQKESKDLNTFNNRVLDESEKIRIIKRLTHQYSLNNPEYTFCLHDYLKPSIHIVQMDSLTPKNLFSYQNQNENTSIPSNMMKREHNYQSEENISRPESVKRDNIMTLPQVLLRTREQQKDHSQIKHAASTLKNRQPFNQIHTNMHQSTDKNDRSAFRKRQDFEIFATKVSAISLPSMNHSMVKRNFQYFFEKSVPFQSDNHVTESIHTPVLNYNSKLFGEKQQGMQKQKVDTAHISDSHGSERSIGKRINEQSNINKTHKSTPSTFLLNQQKLVKQSVELNSNISVMPAQHVNTSNTSILNDRPIVDIAYNKFHVKAFESKHSLSQKQLSLEKTKKPKQFQSTEEITILTQPKCPPLGYYDWFESPFEQKNKGSKFSMSKKEVSESIPKPIHIPSSKVLSINKTEKVQETEKEQVKNFVNEVNRQVERQIKNKQQNKKKLIDDSQQEQKVFEMKYIDQSIIDSYKQEMIDKLGECKQHLGNIRKYLKETSPKNQI